MPRKLPRRGCIARNASRNHCKIIQKTLQNHLENIAKSSRKHCQIIPKTLPNHPGNIAKSSRKHPKIIQKTSQNHPENIALHRLAWPCIALHSLAQSCIALHSLAQSCIALHSLAQHCIVLHSLAQSCIALHSLAQFCAPEIKRTSCQMEDGCKTYSTLKSGGKGGGHGAMTKNCFGVGAFYFDRPGSVAAPHGENRAGDSHRLFETQDSGACPATERVPFDDLPARWDIQPNVVARRN